MPGPEVTEPSTARPRRRARRPGRPSTSAGTRFISPTKSATNGVARVGVELLRRVQLLQPALAHDPDPVGHGEGLLLVVGDEERGGADLELDATDLVAQLGAHLGVERRQRLVEQQHRRLDGQRPGQRDPLLLAAGELGGVVVGLVREPDELEHLPRPGGPLGPVDLAQPQAELDVGLRGQVGEQRVGLEDHAHVALVGRDRW